MDRLTCPTVHMGREDTTMWGSLHRPQEEEIHSVLRNVMVYKELGVSELYQELEKELGADIAIVIKDQEISGEDFLDLTEANIVKLFSKMEQKVL